MPIPMLTRASAGVESAAVVAVAAPATNAALSASFANLFIVDSLVLAFPSIAGPLWEGTAEPQMNNVNRGAPVAIGLQMTPLWPQLPPRVPQLGRKKNPAGLDRPRGAS